MNIVIDTDVGTDVDDLIALTYTIKSGAEIKAIRTVYGDAEIRAKIVKKLERILGVDVPIIAGANKTLGGDSEKWWCGFEATALSIEEREAKFSNSKFKGYEKDDILVCIGPLTNLAVDIKKGITKNLETVYFMGENLESHNFEVDKKASEIVLSQPFNKYFITKPVSKKIALNATELLSLRGTELGNFIHDSALMWLFASEKEKAPMYDVLTVSAALGEDFVKFREEDGRMLSYDVGTRLKEKIMGAIK